MTITIGINEDESGEDDQSDQSDQSIHNNSNKLYYLKKNKFNINILINFQGYIYREKYLINKNIYKTELYNKTPFIEYLINKRINCIYSDSYSHIAAFIPSNIFVWNSYDSKSLPKIAIGQNSERCRFNSKRIKTHAEMDALFKMENLLRINKIKKNRFNLIVLRTNRRGDIRESAPCYHCTKELSKNKNIKIDKLYFSRDDGSVSCIKFDDWKNKGTKHISKGWRWVQKCHECSQ